MSTSNPIFEYHDHIGPIDESPATRIAVDVPGDGTIRLRIACGSVGAVVDLSLQGAQRLTSMLGGACTLVITRGLGGSEHTW